MVVDAAAVACHRQNRCSTLCTFSRMSRFTCSHSNQNFNQLTCSQREYQANDFRSTRIFVLSARQWRHTIWIYSRWVTKGNAFVKSTVWSNSVRVCFAFRCTLSGWFHTGKKFQRVHTRTQRLTLSLSLWIRVCSSACVLLYRALTAHPGNTTCKCHKLWLLDSFNQASHRWLIWMHSFRDQSSSTDN